MRALGEALDELSGLLRWDEGLGLLLSTNGVARPLGRGGEGTRALRDFLHGRYFCRWAPSSSRYGDRSSGEPTLVAALSAACRGFHYWEPGWQVVSSDEGWAFVSNGRLCLFVDERRHLDPPDAGNGAQVGLRLPCGRENLVPGYFSVVSPAGALGSRGIHCKAYLNLTPDASPPLIEALLAHGGAQRLRFEGKFVNDPGAYGRVDTGVLYFEPAARAGVHELLLSAHRANPGWFRPGTPLFTQELATGLSVAESPASAEGFGQLRCRLLAEELSRALEEGLPSGGWLGRVVERFGREGIRVEPEPPARRRRPAQPEKSREPGTLPAGGAP